MKLKIKKMGDDLGISIPKEVLDKLQVSEGDTIYLCETANGVQLTTYDPAFEQVMQAAQEISDRYHNALKELAQ